MAQSDDLAKTQAPFLSTTKQTPYMPLYTPPSTPDRLIRLPEVKHLTSHSRSKIYNLIKDRRFPRQRKLGTKSVWSYCEIQEYIRGALAGNE